MRKRRLSCVLALVGAAAVIGFLAVPVAAQSDSQREGSPSVADLVRRQLDLDDKDGDGKIGKSEAGPRLRRSFDLVDRDRDGFLDSDELAQLAEQLQSRWNGRRRPAQANRNGGKPTPTQAEVAYGPHPRNVLDFWRAESSSPAPLAVFIHGGGFVGGSKEALDARTLRELLKAGISVAALHYRFVTQSPLPAAHHDCRRALQFLRSKSEEWNIDKTRVGAFGGSAGAQVSMYLAFHDEMADPQSDDPVERESTRLTCVATTGGQTTLDLSWWREHIPGYEEPHRDPKLVFGAIARDEYLKRVSQLSALTLVSKDDPPIFMVYAMKPDSRIPDEPKRAINWKVHHVAFGAALKEKMDALGIEADLAYPGSTTNYNSIPEFFIAKLKPRRS